ncbi:MAG: sigma-70 family RNA polymerase sigma factor [Alkalinema sp. CAN_BIN05]|nr:sigma-70 family RNA polymerase sigma factor [Alkalinema sp. CAN_BIN05]
MAFGSFHHSDEPQWINRIAKQDQIALSQLYDRYAKIIYSVAYRSLESIEESEELVMDVFSQVWRTADRYDQTKARVDTWLFMIARSRVCDRLRSSQRRGKVTDTLIAFDAVIHTFENEDVEISERRAIVSTAMGTLPIEQRQVLELSYYGGLSHREISDQTGLALGTVKTRIRLGLEKLRSSLQPWFIDSV